jgi:L-lysine exporter family protein LysE/ArgO
MHGMGGGAPVRSSGDGCAMLAEQTILQPLSAGLLLGFGFVFSIGPQNLMLIQSGADRNHPLSVATTGYLSEVLIVTVGAIGLGASLREMTSLGFVLRVLGIAFLIWYGLHAILRRHQAARAGGEQATLCSRHRAVRSMLVVTWFNPLVYLEVVFLLGVVASGFGHEKRWWFVTGFLIASGMRFYGWSLAGRLLHPWLAVPRRRVQFAVVSGGLLLCSAGLLTSQIAGQIVGQIGEWQ